jgi:hypothetical protein
MWMNLLQMKIVNETIWIGKKNDASDIWKQWKICNSESALISYKYIYNVFKETLSTTEYNLNLLIFL